MKGDTVLKIVAVITSIGMIALLIFLIKLGF